MTFSISVTAWLLCEESTDISNLKQLVRVIVKGQAQMHFLKIEDMIDGKAESSTSSEKGNIPWLMASKLLMAIPLHH